MFRCRGLDLPPVSLLSAPVPMLSAPVRPFAVRSVRPFAPCSPVFCLVPVHSGAAHARPSPFISALPVPVCPTLSGPVCPTLSGHIYSCAARRHPFLAARASRSPHCPSPFHLFPVRGHPVGRLRHDGRSLDLSPRGSIYIGAAENSDGSTTEQRLDRQKPGFCGTAGGVGCVPERALFPPGDDIFAVSCCDIQNFSYLCTRFHLRLRGGPAGFFEKSEKSGNFIPNNLRDKIFMPTFAIQNGEYCRCSSVGQSS